MRRAARTTALVVPALTIALIFPALTVTPAPAAFAAPMVITSNSLVATSSTGSPVVLSSYEAALVTGVNDARAAAGVPQLRVSGGATDIARRWSASLSNTATLLNNPNLGSQLAATGSPSWQVAAENVAAGSDPSAVVTTYLTSARHKANILDRRFGALGVGATSNGTARVIDVLDFVDSADARATTTAPGYEPPPVAQPTPPATSPPVVSPPVTQPATPVATTPSPFDLLLAALRTFLSYFGIVIPGINS